MPAVRPDRAQKQNASRVNNVGWVLKRAASLAGLGLARTITAGSVLLQRLDPRIYFESLRIGAISDGRLDKSSRRLALLVLYAEGPLPVFTRSFIDALNRSAFDLIVVSNRTLDPQARSYIMDHCRLLIERTNIGRDFGGYKDGIAIIMRRYPQIEKLLIANDSVFYLPQGLDALIADLDGEGDFIGVSEIFAHHYHVASFLASFGEPVLRSSAFRRFWSGYCPISTRRWAILRGEGDLTAVLLAAGFQPRVLYRTEALKRHLSHWSADRLLIEAQSLPAGARSRLLRRWDERNLSGTPSKTSARLAEDIAEAIEAQNQMHYGGFLYRRHLGLPVVKRDLVYRGVYPLQDALANLSDLDPPMLNAIAADFQARQNPADFSLVRRMLYSHGAI